MRAIPLGFWRKTTILGQQLADAQDAEAKRLASGDHGESPMPKGEYQRDRGDYSFLSVTALPVDFELRTLVKDFAKLDGESRRRTRACISMKEQYTLIHFAKRSAVLALNEKSSKRCEDGFLALAMIDEERIDFRDAAWAAGLLKYVMRSLGQDFYSSIGQASSISTTGMSRILESESGTTKLSDWGYAEVNDGNRIGLINTENSRFDPALPLTEIAIGVAKQLSDEQYCAEPTISTKLPSIWFPKATRLSAETVLKHALGTILIRGELRVGICDAPDQQMLILWIAEMPNRRESNDLRSFVGDNVEISGRSVVAFSVGRLFGLCVAGSYVEGTSSFESFESLSARVKQVGKQLAGMECG